MEILLAALKAHRIKVPKFLLWKIANDADLELNYSCELAEYFHGGYTFNLAVLRKKKLADRMAKSMSDNELYRYSGNILISCSEYLFLRISDYLVQRYGSHVFERAARSGNVSLLHALRQKHPYEESYPEVTENLLTAGRFQMIEYLLVNDLLYLSEDVHNSSEDVLEEVVAKLPKETIAAYFLKAVNDCPHTASVLRKYL